MPNQARRILEPTEASFELEVPVLIVGGGGCGLAAGLAVRDSGSEVLVLERDSRLGGTTAMSTGLIPAAGTRMQLERGIKDCPELFAEDILRKARGQTDARLVLALARNSARTISWLTEDHGVRLSLVDSFVYPGHTVPRMHGTPERSGSELMAMLAAACGRSGVDILTQAQVVELFGDDSGMIHGARILRPDGRTEDIRCGALALACCGFAGNKEMVAEFIPEIADAEFYGHPGNTGDAIRWGRTLGAAIRDLGGYQGHGGLAAGHGMPILWPVVMHGGFQVNALGRRFANEASGYSEHAAEVVSQPGGYAWMLFDQRCFDLMLEFRDFQDAVEAHAIVKADDVAELAQRSSLPPDELSATLRDVEAMTRGVIACPFGRDFTTTPALVPPYYAVKVRGALFHTQGGLAVDERARVLREDGTPFPNLFAGGGAARGISGPSAWGYLAGNGLLTATTLGRIAGEMAAQLVSVTS